MKILNTIKEHLGAEKRRHFPEAPERQAYIFFNCNEDKTPDSMNVFYNGNVFRDLRDSRRELKRCVEQELLAARIEIEEDNVREVYRHILEGDPLMANQYIKYGVIIAMYCY